MRRILSRWLLATAVACCAPVLAQPTAPDAGAASAYIVQSRGTQSAVRIVKRVGGCITHELPIIHGVSAMLTAAQAARLRQLRTVDLFADSTVVTQDHEGSSYSRSSYSGSGGGYTSPSVPNQDARVEIGADRLGAQGLNGTGVTVAVLDSGLAQAPHSIELQKDLAFLYLKRNERSKARELFLRALKAAPDRHDILTGLAQVLLLDGEYAAAADTYRRVLALRPDDAVARADLGRCLLEMGERDAGEASIRMAMRERPQMLGRAVMSLAMSSRGRFFLRPSAAAKFLRG